MTASNVGVQGIGPEIVLWQEVVVVGVVVHFLHVLGLELLVDMGIAWVVNVIDTLMIGMMEDVMEIGIVLITVTTNMAAATAMLVTGIQLYICLWLLLNYCSGGAFAIFLKKINSYFI